MEYHDLLHTIVKELHTLKDFKPGDEATEFEHLLRSVLVKLTNVLGIDLPIGELYFTTSNDNIGNLEIKCYGDKDGQIINNNNILQYLEKRHVSTLQAVVDILDHRATKIKGPYSAIFTGISQLFETLLHQRDEAEHALINYVWKCLSYEINFYQGIVDNILSPDDTEKLVNYFESHLSDEDSMFSYNHIVDVPLDLNINSESFMKIYRTCLGVCNSEKSNIKLVATAVVSIYKNQEKIDYFEMHEITKTLAEFCNSILPKLFQAMSDRVLVQVLKVHDEDPKSLYTHLDDIIEDFIAVGVEGIDREFPSLVKHYINCMHNEFPTLVDTQDHEFLSTLASLINQVLEFRDNDENVTDIKDVIAEFVSLNKLLLNDNYLHSSTLLMRASTNNYYKKIQIERITFDGWREKLNRVLLLDQVNLGQNGVKLRYLETWYSETIRIQERDLVVGHFYQSQLCRKILQRWKYLLESDKLLEKKASGFFMKKFFSKWRRSYLTVDKNYQTAVEFDKTALLTKHFSWMKGIENLNKLSNELALTLYNSFEEMRDLRIVQRIFHYWFAKIAAKAGDLTKRFNLFKDSSRIHVLNQYFTIWRYKSGLLEMADRLLYQRDVSLLLYMFTKVWQKRFYLNERAYAIEEELNMILRKSLFTKWRNSVQLDTKANGFLHRHLISSAFNKWKLKLKSTNRQRYFQDLIVSRYFQNWVLQLKLSSFLKKKNDQQAKVIFSKWKERQAVLSTLVSKSTKFHDTKLQQAVIDKWNSELVNVQHLENRADDFFKRRFLVNKWESKILELDDSIVVKHLPDEIATRLTFTIWKQKFFIHLEDKLQWRIDQLDSTYSNHLRKSRILDLWRSKLQTVKNLDSVMLVPQAQYAKSKLEFWVLKTEYSKQLMDTALRWESTNITSKFLRIWFERLQVAHLLEDTAEDFEVESNFKLARDILRKWSMHYTKNTKRHQQLCADHIAKKELEKFRSIFELWVYKSKEVEANTTVYSNGSPLSKKGQVTRQLTTPQKRISPLRGSSTPVSKGPSPIKFQETTQRLKDQKMSALRERLGRARGASPPMKLTPVKLDFKKPTTTTTTTAPILGPPLPPHFNVSDIATAKLSGRIRPMMFPVDGISHYSPMDKSKLRARNPT